jgi:hypothetical protein
MFFIGLGRRKAKKLPHVAVIPPVVANVNVRSEGRRGLVSVVAACDVDS